MTSQQQQPRLTIGHLPQLGASAGLYLERFTATLEFDGTSICALGAGIATSPLLASSKARSEAIERLTIDTKCRSLTQAQSISFGGTLCKPDISYNTEGPKTSQEQLRATACHTSVDDALRTAYIESVERGHVWTWAKSFHDAENILAHRVDLFRCTVNTALLTYLRQHPIDCILSYCRSTPALPAVVCLAINIDGGYFYASSAAASSHHMAAEAALLDIAKMLIVEDEQKGFSSQRAFRHSVDDLPTALTDAPHTYAWEPVFGIQAESQFGGQGVLFSSPWLTTLGLYVAAVPSGMSGPYPRALDWFT